MNISFSITSCCNSTSLWFQVCDKLPAPFFKTYRKVIKQAANPDVIVEHPGTAHPFQQPLDMLPVAHEPQKRRIGTNIECVRANAHKVSGNSVEFCHQHPDVFGSLRNIVFNAQHPLHPHNKGMFAVHSGQIVEPVNKGNRLIKGERLGVFFETTVQIAQVWHYINNDFAIGNHFKTQHTVRGWVLRSHIQDHLTLTQRHQGYKYPVPKPENGRERIRIEFFA